MGSNRNARLRKRRRTLRAETMLDDIVVAPWDDNNTPQPGTRFVTPDEYRNAVEDLVDRRRFHVTGITSALADAANEDGTLLNFVAPRFYEKAMNAHYRAEGASKPLVYDTYVAQNLMIELHELVEAGLLAHQGNGDHYHYRLALPIATEPDEPTTDAG